MANVRLSHKAGGMESNARKSQDQAIAQLQSLANRKFADGGMSKVVGLSNDIIISYL